MFMDMKNASFPEYTTYPRKLEKHRCFKKHGNGRDIYSVFGTWITGDQRTFDQNGVIVSVIPQFIHLVATQGFHIEMRFELLGFLLTLILRHFSLQASALTAFRQI